MQAGYTSNQEFLEDYARLLRLRLAREAEAVQAVRRDRAPPPWQDPGGDGVEALQASMARRAEATPECLPVCRLASIFGLSEAEREVVLMLLVTGLDERFGRVFAYLQEDAALRWLTPGLAWRLLGMNPLSPEAHALFAEGSPLLAHEFILLEEQGRPLASRPLALDDRIAGYLLGVDGLDARVRDCVSLERAEPAAGAHALDDSLRRQLANLASVWQAEPSAVVWFRGPAGAGKRAAARYLAGVLGKELLVVDGPALQQAAAGVRAAWRALQREQRLRDAVVYVRDIGAIEAGTRRWLLRQAGPRTLVASEDPNLVPEAPDVLALDIPMPDHATRREHWALALQPTQATDADPGALAEELAGGFRLTPGRIEDAAASAWRIAALREGAGAVAARADYFEAARLQSTTNLGSLAVKVTATHGWDDLVLPPGVKARLQAIVSQARNASRVYEDWGFSPAQTAGRGLAALFSGPSGTGKTMAAGVIARALGLDMYRIDLARVVSKYIGETEKNLDAVFAEAVNANAVLFFDEADALFGKRSEVKDAHDRYANIEISYLLQKMEEYEGLAILATNFGQNLDEAFNRRLHFIVEFPLPRPEDRLRIWRQHMPPRAPVSDEIDWDFLASRFELTGGSIRNCVRAAAFAAAEADAPIGMEHLVQAVAEELAKLGRPLQRADFGPYYAGVTDARRGRPAVGANGHRAG